MSQRHAENALIIMFVCAVCLAGMAFHLLDKVGELTIQNELLKNQVLDVYQLQTMLQQEGYYKGLIDGDCGRATKAAWFSFTQDRKMVKFMTESGRPER